jgi:hypothetical protein
MTTQEAYVRVAELLATSKAMIDEVWQLANEHGLLVGVRERDGHPEALDPKFYTIEEKQGKNWKGEPTVYKVRTFRKDLTDEEIYELARAWDVKYPDPDWIRERLEDKYDHLEEQWVPSRFC